MMGCNVKKIGNNAFFSSKQMVVAITAQTPPEADPYIVNWYNRHALYLQGAEAVQKYENAATWKNFFWFEYLSEPQELIVDGDTTIKGKPGDTFKISTQLKPANIHLPYVFIRSTNPEIAMVNAGGTVTIRAASAEQDNVAQDDSSERSCKIIAETMYANGPTVEITVIDISSAGVENVELADNNEDIDYNAPFDVYNINGVRVSDCTENLTNGFYIIRQGKNVKKIVVK